MFVEYGQYDAVGLAELIKSGKVDAKEILQTAVGAIEAENPRLNAVVIKLYDEGRRTPRRRCTAYPFSSKTS
jgi:amidase